MGGMGGQLPIEDSMPYYPDVPTRAAVHVPPDPKGVLDSGHGVRDLLANDTLIIVRYVHVHVHVQVLPSPNEREGGSEIKAGWRC